MAYAKSERRLAACYVTPPEVRPIESSENYRRPRRRCLTSVGVTHFRFFAIPIPDVKPSRCYSNQLAPPDLEASLHFTFSGGGT